MFLMILAHETKGLTNDVCNFERHINDDWKQPPTLAANHRYSNMSCKGEIFREMASRLCKKFDDMADYSEHVVLCLTSKHLGEVKNSFLRENGRKKNHGAVTLSPQAHSSMASAVTRKNRLPEPRDVVSLKL